MIKKRAVLFDMDGVLVPTEKLRAKAHAETVRNFGGKIPVSFYQKIGGVGKAHKEVRAAFIDRSEICASAQNYTRVFRRILKEFLRDISPTPGVVGLLQTLREKGYLLGVVSSSESVEVEKILRRASLVEFFDAVVCGDQAARKKPAPDLYLLALSRLHLNPASAVAIEDSDSGVTAALKAGLRVLAYRHQHNPNHSFAGANKVFDSFLPTKRLARLILTSHR